MSDQRDIFEEQRRQNQTMLDTNFRLECLKLANANAQLEHKQTTMWEQIDQKTVIEKADQMFNYVIGNDWQNVDVGK